MMPQADDNHINVRFRFPDGKTSQWRFSKKTGTVRDLYCYVFTVLPKSPTNFLLVKPYPKVELKNADQSILAAGIEEMDMITVSL